MSNWDRDKLIDRQGFEKKNLGTIDQMANYTFKKLYSNEINSHRWRRLYRKQFSRQVGFTSDIKLQ